MDSSRSRLYWQRLEGQVANVSAGGGERGANGDIYGLESRATAGFAACCSGYLSVSYAEEGDNSGIHVPGANWVAQGAVGMSASWGNGWRTSIDWYSNSNDTAGGLSANLLGLALIKDFTWLGSRIRLTLTGRHASTGVEANTGYASVTVSY